MGLYKRGKKWYCSITDARGRLIRKALSENKQVAETILAKMRTDFQLQKAGVIPMAAPDVGAVISPEEVRREFVKSRERKGRSEGYYTSFALLWREIVEDNRLTSMHELTQEVMERWLSSKIGTLKNQSVNQKVALFGVFTKWAVKNKYLDADPLVGWEQLKEQDKRYRRDLSVDEARAIINVEVHPEYKLRWLVYFFTGLRNKAGASLCWEWIDWQERILTLPAAANKSKKPLRLPMHPELLSALQAVHEERGLPKAGEVFPLKSSTRLLRRFRRACLRAGVDIRGVCLHSVRHTVATLLYEGTGRNLKAVQEMLGHASVATTAVYLHVNDDIKRSAVETLKFIG